ncbi:hypothetical protein GOODEAATRI_000487, partial [Goodea atripinnis]
IPFGLDSDVDIVMGNPIDSVFRSVSTDNLTTGIPALSSPAASAGMTRVPFSPPEELSHLVSASAPLQRSSWIPFAQTAPLGELPTIEEARQVVHIPGSKDKKKGRLTEKNGREVFAGRPEPRLCPEGAPAGFFLHSPEEDSSRLSSSAPCRSGVQYRPVRGNVENAERQGRRERSGKHSDMSRDDDSVLRDGSIDSSEASDDAPRNAPGNIRPSSGKGTHNNNSPHMTSFAERRDNRRRHPATPGEESTSAPTPTTPGTPHTPSTPASGQQGSPGLRGSEPGSEAWELGARLEEKRKNIEAQKKRIEVIISSSCPAPRTKLHSSSSPRSPKQSSHPHHQAHPRPSELKFPPLNRVLAPTQNVDTIPHLRRVSPSKCQVQTSSSFRIGGLRTPQESPQPAQPLPPDESTSDTGSSETPTQFSLELEQEDAESVGALPVLPQFRQERPRTTGGSSSGAPSECSFESDTLSLSAAYSAGGEGERGDGPTQPCSLIEVSLSSVGEPEGGSDEPTDEGQEFSSDSMSDHTESAAEAARGPDPQQQDPIDLLNQRTEGSNRSEAQTEPAEDHTGYTETSEPNGEKNEPGTRGGIGFFFKEMEKSSANHFLILFRDSNCQFRGVYTMNPDTQELVRLAGVGPRAVSSSQVESIFKYSSDRKQFSTIPSKTMGMSVDAFTIPSQLWQGGGGGGAGGGGSRRASVTKKVAVLK